MSLPKILVSEFDCSSVNKYIDALIEIQKLHGPNQEILVEIDSFGGQAHSLIRLVTFLRTMKNPIVTYTSSKAMSCGLLLLSISGSKRYASKEATLLLHEMSAGVIGDIKDMEDSVAKTKTLNTRVFDMLAKKTKYKDAEDIRKLIKKHAQGHDLFMTADQAKKLGFIDEVADLSLVHTSYYSIVKS